MNIKDVSTLMRFIGFVDGLSFGMNDDTQRFCAVYIEEAETILQEEMKSLGGDSND